MSLTTWALQTLEPKDLCLALYEHDALVAEYVMPFSWSVWTQKKWSRKRGASCRKQQTHFSSLLPTPCKLFRTFWSSWNSYRPQAMRSLTQSQATKGPHPCPALRKLICQFWERPSSKHYPTFNWPAGSIQSDFSLEMHEASILTTEEARW